jgi:hypothetical protein
LSSPKAFSIVIRIALIAPVFLFFIAALVSYFYQGYIWAASSIFFMLLAIYNLYRNWNWMKIQTENTIAETVFKLEVEKEKGDDVF